VDHILETRWFPTVGRTWVGSKIFIKFANMNDTLITVIIYHFIKITQTTKLK